MLLPGMELPLVVFEPRYRELIQECQEENEPFGILLLKAGREVGPNEIAPYLIGTTAHIERVEQTVDGRLHIRVLGRDRFRVVSFGYQRPYLSAEVEYLPKDLGEVVPSTLLQRVRDVSTRYLNAVVALHGGYLSTVSLPEEPEELSYTLALLFQSQRWTQQRLLEAATTVERLTEEAELLDKSYAELKDRVRERWAHDRTIWN